MVFQEQVCEGIRLYKKRIDGGRIRFRGLAGREDEGHFIFGPELHYRLATIGTRVISELHHPLIVPELGENQFEFNYPPRRLSGHLLSTWESECLELLRILRGGCSFFGASPLLTAFPPVLFEEDIGTEKVSQGLRFQRINAEWVEARRSLPNVQFDGFSPNDISFAATRSALQLHLELPVDPVEAGFLWNVVLLITPLALAAATGAPRFLHGVESDLDLRIRMWDQLDDLDRGRVFYGPGWVSSAFEILDNYGRIPFIHLGEDLDEEDPLIWFRRQVKNTWCHVRLIPEVDHWRIENRVFSAMRPFNASVTAALYYGLIEGLSATVTADSIRKLPFSAVQTNFKAAARLGLDATMHWIDGERWTAKDLLLHLLPLIEEGLRRRSIDEGDIERFLGAGRIRITNRITPAHWIRRTIRSGNGLLDSKLRHLAAEQLRVQDLGEPLT